MVLKGIHPIWFDYNDILNNCGNAGAYSIHPIWFDYNCNEANEKLENAISIHPIWFDYNIYNEYYRDEQRMAYSSNMV